MNNKAFTLVEMCVVLMIIGMITISSLPFLVSAAKACRRLQDLIDQANAIKLTIPVAPAPTVATDPNVLASPQPGYTVTAVKFCEGYTTVYPTSFPEYGFCINGKLYATFSENGAAWTTEVAVGAYISTSTSAPCSFQYLGNCQIGKF